MHQRGVPRLWVRVEPHTQTRMGMRKEFKNSSCGELKKLLKKRFKKISFDVVLPCWDMGGKEGKNGAITAASTQVSRFLAALAENSAILWRNVASVSPVTGRWANTQSDLCASAVRAGIVQLPWHPHWRLSTKRWAIIAGSRSTYHRSLGGRACAIGAVSASQTKQRTTCTRSWHVTARPRDRRG